MKGTNKRCIVKTELMNVTAAVGAKVSAATYAEKRQA